MTCEKEVEEDGGGVSVRENARECGHRAAGLAVHGLAVAEAVRCGEVVEPRPVRRRRKRRMAGV